MQKIFELPWWQLGLTTFVYFIMIYFVFAFFALFLRSRVFMKAGVGNLINPQIPDKFQVFYEIKSSFVSMAVFSAWIILTQYAYLNKWIFIKTEASLLRYLLEMLFLFFWNEIHFYLCHRLLHYKWFFKNVHYVHHRSLTPTPFATYSFHWFEAFLLGSVVFIPMFFYEFSFAALFSFPVMSIFLNVLGHSDYDIFPQKKLTHILTFTRRHSLHHSKTNGNFGFILSFMDRILNTSLKEKNNT